MTDPVVAVAQQLNDPANGQGLQYAQMRQGVITAINASDNSCSLNLSGDTSTVVAGVKCLTTYQPVVGDTIWLLKSGTDLIGIGKVGQGTFTAYGQVQNFCTGTTVVGAFTGSTAYVNLGSTPNSATLTKRFSTSNLFVAMSVTGWGDVATGQILQTAVNISGTDYSVAAANARSFTGNSFVSATVTAAGTTVIPSIPAGSVTATIRVRNVVTTGNIHVDTGDYYSLTIQEVL
jgi:hypothetical protein